MKRILVTGTSGQVGWELARSLMPLGEVICAGRALLDLAEPSSLRQSLMRLKPDIVVNPAAYTAVDKAESEPRLAHRVNADAPGELAAACAELGALFVHYSTDYVFDGSKSTAYLETDAPNPQSVYGRSKLAGENAIQAAGARSLILRTSWVYGARGKNFLLTMLRLAKESDELRVVADQFGAPTASRLIADATAQIVAKIPDDAAPPVALAHLTCSGLTSWHGFASRIVAHGARLSLCREVPVVAIKTTDFPTPAMRPAYSKLDTRLLGQAFGLELPKWEETLLRCLESLPPQGR